MHGSNPVGPRPSSSILVLEADQGQQNKDQGRIFRSKIKKKPAQEQPCPFRNPGPDKSHQKFETSNWTRTRKNQRSADPYLDLPKSGCNQIHQIRTDSNRVRIPVTSILFVTMKLTKIIHLGVFTAKMAIKDNIAATTRNIDDKIQMK